LILPVFARSPIRRERIGMYRYLGGGHWHTVPKAERQTFLAIGL
jgi:hypothetical protein